jgi:hypothetical protein
MRSTRKAGSKSTTKKVVFAPELARTATGNTPLDTSSRERNPHDLKGRHPTRFGPSSEHYLTEEEVSNYSTHVWTDLRKYIYQIYDKEYERLFNELSRNMSSKKDVAIEVKLRIETKKDFFARYQDVMNKVRTSPADKAWFKFINDTYGNTVSLKVCLTKVADVCITILFGIFLARYFGIMGGGKNKTKKRR